MSPETALWLLPAVTDLEPLAGQARRLSERFGAPAFTPHVTLFGGLTAPREVILEAVAHVARERAPFSLEPKGIAHSALFFQCLVLDFGEAPEVLELRAQLAPHLGKRPEDAARPHLSLLYADLSQSECQALAREIKPPARIRFDRLCLVAPGDGLAGWGEVAGWREEWVRGLGG